MAEHSPSHESYGKSPGLGSGVSLTKFSLIFQCTKCRNDTGDPTVYFERREEKKRKLR
jgi:hypothetical protein